MNNKLIGEGIRVKISKLGKESIGGGKYANSFGTAYPIRGVTDRLKVIWDDGPKSRKEYVYHKIFLEDINEPKENEATKESINELPNLSKSTENLSKIADKDEWLNGVRGNEPIEEISEKYATELGYPQSDKMQFTCTFWTHHNIAAQGFIDGVNFKNKLNKEHIGEDGLLKKFKALRLQIFTKMDSIPTVLSDYPTEKTANDLTQIAKQYSDSKLSELEKWIDENKFIEHGSRFILFAKIKDKIKSLKQ